MNIRRFAALTAIAVLGIMAHCSIAPLLTMAANRIVLVEVFSSPG